MTKKRSLIIAAVLTPILAGAGWYTADAFYFTQHARIKGESEELARRTESFKAASAGIRESRLELRDIAATMLGSEQIIVEHRIRGLLSEIAEREGLREVVVSHGRPRAVDNPAQARGSGVNRGLRRLLGKQQDFAVIHARVQGLGSLEQVLDTLAAIRSQPWIHRVEGFTISPKGRERLVYELKADLATIFAPDLVSPEAESPELRGFDAESLSFVAALVGRDPFHLAEPVVAVPPPSPPPLPAVKPESTPAPPYDKWRLTGVLEMLAPGDPGDPGETGEPEASSFQVMLARVDTGELRTMLPGDTLLGATLESASGESAQFTLDGRRVVVRTGQTLAEARPAESVHSESTPHPQG